ncbi:unnamed protein product [Plutella xylostella]|uniref:(diamondback moth) hypothetical protein n=1 Tax=Plutella xylostella TaxID=51655 RepID=A0A8S4G833_PLUXY|nr:unnamed protein product [Plutella xylostella]
MENVLKPPESEIENTEVSESHNNGQRDLSLTDSSLTESAYSPSSALENQVLQRLTSSANQEASISGILPHTNRENEQAGEQSKQLFKHPADLQNRSSKEEKQRQNEEIVTLESSSLSSETGSWESVFPVRLAEKQKDACTAFINNERSSGSGESSAPVLNRKPAVVNLSNDPDAVLVQRSPFKSTSCFIDAASLVDDDDVIQVQSDDVTLVGADVLPAPSQPLACTTAKNDLSPLDWSESYDNDDSLEQLDKKDPDSLKKDMSPTIFDMTPVTEDSLGGTFEEAAQKEDAKQNEERDKEKEESFPVTYEYKHITPGYTRIMTSTPHNSLGAPKMKTLDVEDCDSDSTVVSGEGSSSHYFDYSSGGTTKDDHVSQPSSQPGSLLSRKKMQNIPIVSAAYNPTANVFKTSPPKPKVSNASAWVVDMSSIEDDSKPAVPENRRPGDRMCETLKSEEKQRNHDSGCSRSSVDSDSSERSSHKFYIDLSSLPDHSPPKIDNSKSLNEKKNIFSMYIDLGEQPPVKEMPARLSSSLNAKRNAQSAKTSPRPKAKTNSSLKTNKNDVGVSSSSTPSRSVKKTADTRLATAEHESPKGFSLFEEYENLCANTEISISEIIGLPEKVTKLAPKKSPKSDVGIEKDEKIQTKTLSAVTKQVQAKESSKEVFVRLSDLDKKRLYVESSDTIYEHCVSDIRMTRSIPDTNWVDPSHHAVNSRSIEVISSFHSENTLSLNRLFPHLKNEFSRSMPSSLASRTRSPMRLSSSNGEVEEVISDLSELSSVQSSYHRSVVEKSTTDDSQTSSLIGNCQSRLGEDLLRMFLEEIAPDVIVEVSGKRFKAHKCILSSRCQYFAGILSGGWVESAGNVIVLPPFSYNVVHFALCHIYMSLAIPVYKHTPLPTRFSYNVVHFALCHIYSGASRIPDSVSMVELATLADMLGLEGLKEAIMFTLKVKYCHNFHKPCQVCTAGVLECFPLSSVYGLDELYLKCLRWITKHFHKVWPTKAFATLPKELLDKCYQQHIVNMSTDTLVDTVCGCGLTEAALPSTRWAETVGRLCRRLLNAAAHYTAARLSSVVRLALQRAPPPAAAQTVDDCVAAAIEWAPPNEACRYSI